MRKFILSLISSLITIVGFGQCETRDYINIAHKVFNHKLSSSDISTGVLFLTIDTVDATNINSKSLYIEYDSARDLVINFYKVFDAIKKDGNFFNYYEFINYSVYPSPLHQSFLINSDIITYKIDIWNNKDDISKIDGLTIQKLQSKVERTPY
jgi:hypothetical protein